MSHRPPAPKPLPIARRNATFQVFDALKNNRRQRAKRGLIFVEGVSAINCLLKNGGTIETFITAAERRPSAWAQSSAERANAHVVVSAELMADLSERDNPSEAIAIARRPIVALPPPNERSRFLVFDRPGSEGNLGSIVRTADAFAVDAVVIAGHGVDVYDPKTIRASIGTVFNRPIANLEGPELDQWIIAARDDHGLEVVTTSGVDGEPLPGYAPAGGLVLIIGNETHGVSRHLRDLADRQLNIPMAGFASSLNVSAATAILLYALRRPDALD